MAAAVCFSALIGQVFYCPGIAEDKNREPDVADNLFSIDEDVSPCFSNVNDRSMERLFGKEIQPPPGQTFRLLPSLSKEQRQKIQDLCENCRKESVKLTEELKTLRTLADQRRKESKSKSTAQNAPVSKVPAKLGAADWQSRTSALVSDESDSYKKHKDKKDKIVNSKKWRGASLPLPLQNSATFDQIKEHTPVVQAKTDTKSSTNILLNEFLVWLGPDEIVKASEICNRLVNTTRDTTEQIDLILSDTGRLELQQLRQGEMLPDFLSGSYKQAVMK